MFDHKPEILHAIPNISGESIRKTIAFYDAIKLKESGPFYQLTHPVSELMRALKNFYNITLRKKASQLNSKECLKLIKILYINQYKSGKKSNKIKNHLLQFFDLNVISAISASAENVDLLSDHFPTMCASPEHANYIAYTVFQLIELISLLKKTDILNELYAEKFYKQIYTNPALAKDIAFVFQKLSYIKLNDPLELLKKDRMLYLLVLLKHINELTNALFKKIKHCTIKELNNLSYEISITPCKTKEILTNYFLKEHSSENNEPVILMQSF